HSNATSATRIYTLSLHDALPICAVAQDKKTELFGIIGLDGNWIIAPSFLKLTPNWGNKNLFRGQPSDEEKSYEYRYDMEKKSLRSEEHTSELQSRENLVCRLLLE